VFSSSLFFLSPLLTSLIKCASSFLCLAHTLSVRSLLEYCTCANAPVLVKKGRIQCWNSAFLLKLRGAKISLSKKRERNVEQKHFGTEGNIKIM
jgi:hypothetical protein